MTLRIALLISLLLSLTACPTRKVNRRPHEGPVAEQAQVALPNAKANNQEFNQAPVGRAEVSLRSEKSDLFKDVIVPLGKFVMNRNYVENPDYTGTLKMRSILTAYNSALVRLLATNPELVKKEKLLEQYEKLLLSGCDTEASNLDGCVNIRFFRTDFSTAKIVQKIAEQRADVKQYYRLLGLAFELQNRTRDKELEFMYFKRAREYAAYFSSLDEKDKQRPGIRRHAIVFETLLCDYAANPKSEEFRKFIFEFEPWSFSRLKSNPFRSGMQCLLKMAAQNYLYEADGSLSKNLQDFLKDSQENKGKDENDSKELEKKNPSFTQIIAKLNSGIYSRVLSNLGVNTKALKLDEYFFVVDRLYLGHFEVDHAVQIWSGIRNKDSARLTEIIALYMRVQIVNMIIDTNEFMRKIYGNPKYDSTTMIRKVLEESKEISDRWFDMLTRMDKLKRLVNSQMKTFGEDSKVKDINQMFDSLRRNIKYMVVYPNMFLMSYFVSQNKAKFRVYTWFGAFDVDHTSLIKAFMSGETTPWFRFGNDELGLSKIEMLYAYYFSLNNGSFETFAQIKDAAGNSQVDRVKFLKEIIKEYMGENNVALRDAIDKQNVYFSTNEYRKFQNYCAREKAGDRNYSFEMDFEKVHGFTFIGGGETEYFWHKSAEAPAKFYREAVPTLLSINDTVRFKLAVVRTMIKILQNNLSKLGLSEQDSKAWTDQIDAIVKETEQHRRDFVNTTIKRHREIGTCVETMRRLELERQTQLFNEEIAHLKSVYKEISGLQSLSGEALKAKELQLNAKYGFTTDNSANANDVVERYKFDVITQKYYRYSKFDLVMRMIKRMSKMRPMAAFNNIPADLNLSVEYYRNKMGNSINVINAQGELISEREFVGNAMRYLSGLGENPYLSWMTQSTHLEFNDKKIRALSQLYHITYGNDEFKDGVKPAEIIGEVLNMIDIAAIKNDEKEILRYMGRERKVSVQDLRKFVIDAKTGEELPLFENSFKITADNKVQLLEAQQFYLAIKHAGYFLFSPSKDVINIMRSQYTPIVDSVRLRNDDLLAAVTEQESKINPEYLNFIYEFNGDKEVRYRQGQGGDKVKLLTNRSIRDAESTLKDFDFETEGYFKKKTMFRPKKASAK